MGIKVVNRKRSFSDNFYLIAIFAGLRLTISHFLRNLKNTKKIPTMQYPEERPKEITKRYRGIHRLTKYPDGEIKCVACYMCATACPAECIYIVAKERDDGKEEKEPKIFNIDLLECVFCGMCVEACPKDAIRMDTGKITFVGRKREDFVLTKEKLLSFNGAFDD